MVSIGDNISASDYNTLYNSVAPVLTSYGTTVRSNTIAGSSTTAITQAQWLDMFLDIQSAYVHQTGSVSTNIALPESGITATISGATRTNPVVISVSSAVFANSDTVKISSVAGMTQLNGNTYYVKTGTTANTYELYSDSSLTTTVDGSAYGTYTSGGTAERWRITIGADTSFVYNEATGTKSAVASGTLMGYNDYLSVANLIVGFNPAVTGFPPGNLNPNTPLTSSRSTSWGGAGEVQAVYHVLTVTFASQTERDEFFAAGGELRFSASLTGGSGNKYLDWQGMFTAMSTVYFDKYEITASSGTPTPSGSGGSGYDSLTSAYRQLFIKSGSGVYADNDYTIEGRLPNTTSIRFRITFNDGDAGTPGGLPPDFVDDPIDESVTGTVTSTVLAANPDSSFVYKTVTYTAVSVAAPTLATAVALTVDNVSAPA